MAKRKISKSAKQLTSDDCPLSPWTVGIEAIAGIPALGILIGIEALAFWGLADVSLVEMVTSKSFWFIAGFLLIVDIGGTIHTYVTYRNFRFVFARDKVTLFNKVIGTSISHFYYDRIQDVRIQQGAFQRLVGTATVTVQTASESGMFTIGDVSMDHAETIKQFLLRKSGHGKTL